MLYPLSFLVQSLSFLVLGGVLVQSLSFLVQSLSFLVLGGVLVQSLFFLVQSLSFLVLGGDMYIYSVCFYLMMGFFDVVKKVMGFGSARVPTRVLVSSQAVFSGNAVKQTERYLLYAEHLLEYTLQASVQFKPSFDKGIKNEYREDVLKAWIKRFHDYVVASYLGTLTKLRNNSGLTGLRFMRLLPSETVEQNYFSLSIAKLNAALRGKKVDVELLKVTMHEGLDRINASCTVLLAECKSLRSNAVQAGEAKRIQDIGLQVKVNLMKHHRAIPALEYDFSKVTSLNVLTKMQRLEGAIIDTSRLYMSFEASLSTATLRFVPLVRIVAYIEESTKSFAISAAKYSSLKVQLRALKAKASADNMVVLSEFRHLADTFISECRVRDLKLIDLLDSLTFKELTKAAAA